MKSYQVAAETITALVTATVAGLALALPIDFGWTSQTSALQLDLLAYSLPRAVAAGVIIAMITAVLITTLASTVAAWGATLGGLLVLLINHVFGHAADPASSLSTMNFIDSFAGGVILGALGAAVLHHKLSAYAWTLGVLISLLLGSVNPLPRVGGGTLDETLPDHWQATDMPPTWMIEVSLVLVVAGLLWNRNRPPADRPSIELPMAPILAGVVLVLVTLASAEWLARHGDSLAGIVLAVVTAIVTAFIAAMLLPGRDGELVLTTVPVSSVGAATLAVALPAWAIPVSVAIAAAGMWYGSRRHAPIACLALLIVLDLVTASTSDTSRAWIIVGSTAVLAWLYGFGLTSARTRYVPSRVLGSMVVFVPSAVMGMRDYVARGHYALQTSDHSVVCTVATEATSSPAWTALLITAGCLGGILVLRRNRPLPDPAESGESGESAGGAGLSG